MVEYSDLSIMQMLGRAVRGSSLPAYAHSDPLFIREGRSSVGQRSDCARLC